MSENTLYISYIKFLKKSIMDKYNKNLTIWIKKIEEDMGFSHIQDDDDIIFHKIVNNTRIEIHFNKNENNISFRILDYNIIWINNKWNDRYIIYSDFNKDKNHIIKDRNIKIEKLLKQ